MNDAPLPGPDLWGLIRPHTGAVRTARRTARGFGSDLTALVEAEKETFFVKAVRNRPGGRRDSIERERLVNAAVRPLSPALNWHAQNAEWIALGFEAVDGRPARIEPGSADLTQVVACVARIRDIRLPSFARDWHETRWDRFADDPAEATALFRGDTLLHTDVNPDNVLLGPDSTWVVDWAWPTRGAAFIDPACLVLHLVAAGHTAASAESWAARCPAWAEAEPRALDAFATASLRMYRTHSLRRPDAGWLATMADAARAWTRHRGLTQA
ncbi:protein kinase [Streptantibioticus parmotrematis]|uniref:protein kinase n=1 Tax=Streptantibioticus parmotrematis TaxID=2873249 RepID=UPI0033EF4736